MSKIIEEMIQRFEEQPQIMIYKARVTHFYYHNSYLVFVVELLEPSPTHKNLVKGSTQIFSAKHEEASEFDGWIAYYCRDNHSPFNDDSFSFFYQLLVGHDFTFYLKNNNDDRDWVFVKLEKLDDTFSTTELKTYLGRIASVAYTNFELEVLFEIATDKSSYSKEKKSHFRSYIFRVNGNEEDLEIFEKTFAPFIEYNSHSDKVTFSQEQLIVVEPPNKIITVGDVTSIDTSPTEPIKVFPFRKEVE